MEFYHLRSFVVVAETRNLTQAAKRLCSTPPAISAHIKTLEQELGTDLFIRSTKGMTLTKKGELLLVNAQKTLDSAVDMVNLAADSQDKLMGNFTLAVNQPLQQLRIPQLLKNLSENCPGISVQLCQSATGRIFENILLGYFDGGLVYGDVPEDFFALKIKQEKITTIAPKNFDEKSIISAQNLSDKLWITMDKYCPFDNELTKRLGSNYQSKAQSNDEQSRLDLVRNDIGLSFLELSLAEQYQKKGEIKILPHLDFNIDLSFVVADKRINDPIIKALIQEIRIVWNITL
ncbi:LysR family transcriptional regulator [Colwelliaceae bacterium 6441]